MRHGLLCVVAGLACIGSQVWAGDDFYTPVEDQNGLEKNDKTDSALPRVLIIGDSISIGYTKPVIRLLEGKANVQRVDTNCGDTRKGVAQLDKWLGNTSWDVIHFNFGLHDLCYRHPEAKVYGHRDKVNGTISVPLGEYAQNIEKIVRRLQKSGAELIWASTTTVPEGEAGRFVGDEIKYNNAAAQIMESHGIRINDLHALTSAFKPDRFRSPGDVHYTKQGYEKLARQVAAEILEALNGREKINK